ncbi:hypothetical protein [Halocatena pleomorpha]|uniref:Uncharacterized protein n=1 Tax=Halocatena pleomorpha TaxID=1785090 RepID=A0A3P3R7U3_9EURY|nr:hypothetical protein [Halocatena pleomorpha]RRJ29507.1 hypothetical protein EIK79_12785 [Halocatena pleomorpha]
MSTSNVTWSEKQRGAVVAAVAFDYEHTRRRRKRMSENRGCGRLLRRAAVPSRMSTGSWCVSPTADRSDDVNVQPWVY